MTKPEQDAYSIMIIPPNGSKSVGIRIPVSVLKWTVGVGTCVLIGLGVSGFMMSRQSVSAKQIVQMQQQQTDQKKEIDRMLADLEALKLKTMEIVKEEESIKEFLGRHYRTKRRTFKKKRRSKDAVTKFTQAYNAVALRSNSKKERVESTIELMDEMLGGASEFYREFSGKIVGYQAKFASTPSIWPVFGRIKSGYGWRRHPILRKRQFHKGVDIPSWMGAPIRSTADGVVIHSGWAGGYGLVVTVDHGNGYRTIYAHCSKLLVHRGQLVKKGQHIANVGSTGLSTGPHIHYEIQQWGRPKHPKAYLNLDLFTASTKIW